MAAGALGLESAAELAIAAATGAGAKAAEAYAVEETGREVRVHGGAVESLTAATERGIGVRAWDEGRVGFAYGTDLGEAALQALGESAAGAAAIADPDEYAAPPEPVTAVPGIEGLSDPTLADWDAGRIAGLATEIERIALAADPRVTGVEQTVYADSTDRVAIRSTTGVAGAFEASTAFAYLQALARGDDSAETGLGFGMGRGPGALDPEAIGAEGAERAVSMIGAGKPSSRSCPVLLDPTVAASFAGLIGGTLAADSVQRGRSPFAERLGEEIASDALVLSDDGLDPAGLASSPFDGEGVARRRTALIDGGVLRTFLHDTYTARRGGAESTGSAGRGGYRSLPSVSASNLIVAEGGSSFEELLEEAGEGVFVTDVAGLHSGVNPVSGVFSVGASGREIAAGELAGPVREFTIASDLVSMLRAVVASGAESRWVPFGGSVRTPPLLVGEMTVSGT